MQPHFSSKQSDTKHKPYRLVLSIVLPIVLVLVFVCKQFINLDSIGWSNGFNHPLTGWDHLLTMLAVGIWAAQLRGQAIWMLPLAFVGVMSLGGLAGAAGLSIPSVEGIILLSCAVFSVLITRKVRFSAKINVLIVAFFAFFHGFAHGQEISTSASLISYTLGFMLATLLLHGAGILVAKLVVLSVTCLLTVMFSSAALAKTFAANIDDHINPATKTSQQTTPDWQASDLSVYEYLDLALSKQNLPSDHATRHRSKITDPPDSTAQFLRSGLDNAVVSARLQSSSEQLKAQPNNHDLLAKPAAVEAGVDDESALSALTPGYSHDNGLNFKTCFPDINHTPGQHLLSNGVGLTSPPVASSTAPQVIPSLCPPQISFIEDANLQTIAAESDAGIQFPKTNNANSHHCGLHCPNCNIYFNTSTPPGLTQPFAYCAPLIHAPGYGSDCAESGYRTPLTVFATSSFEHAIVQHKNKPLIASLKTDTDLAIKDVLAPEIERFKAQTYAKTQLGESDQTSNFLRPAHSNRRHHASPV